MTGTDWLFFGAIALAVMGWATAFGLYLQARDALELARTWRGIANQAWGDVVRERHVAEFAVKTANWNEPVAHLAVVGERELCPVCEKPYPKDDPGMMSLTQHLALQHPDYRLDGW